VISVATTYSTNAKLQIPATSDRNWDVSINANVDALDGMSAIGGLAVTTTETPSATLHVAVSPGNFINSSGVIISFAGTPQFVVPPSSTVYLWLTDAGVLTSGPSFPTSAHLRLAQVVSGATSLVQVIDQRIQCSVAGTGLGFVLKAGDTMTGPLTVASPATGASVLVADSINRLIGFFGATPASQAPALTPLASNSPGVASSSLADVGTTFSQSVLNNNFASLAAKVDALIAALQRHGLMGS
jgi:hypothetical protein